MSTAPYPGLAAQPRLAAPLEQTAGVGLDRLCFYLFALDVFFTYSRFPELMVLSVGFFPPVLVVALRGLTFLLTFPSGAVIKGLNKIGFAWIFVTVWFFLALPFSTWRGGTFNTLTRIWLPSMIVYFSAAAWIDSKKDFRRILYVIGVSALVVAGAATMLGRAMGQGRLGLEAGTLSNGNDMSHLLLAGLPIFGMFWEINPGSRFFQKMLVMAASIPVLMVLVQTASRSAVLLLAVYWAMWFFHTGVKNKIKMTFVGALTAFAILTFAPANTLARYKTLLPFDEGRPETEWEYSAEGSTQARKQTLRESLELTLKNPLFGVGPGVFMSAAAKEAENRGERAQWLVTHNTYTEISSEAGIPGFMLYMAAIVWSFGYVFRARRMIRGIPELDKLHRMGFYLLMIMTGNAWQGLFSSIAYLPFYVLLAGLATAYLKIAERELARHRAATTLPAPVQKPGFGRMHPAFSR